MPGYIRLSSCNEWFFGKQKITGSPNRIRTYNLAVNSRDHALKLLNKTSVSRLAELSNPSKAYISHVKHGKRPPSEKLFGILTQLAKRSLPKDMDFEATLVLFLKSRREGISPDTLRDYKGTLSRALVNLGLAPSTKNINKFLNSLQCSLGGKYGYFKCLRAFYNWLYSPRSGLGYKPEDNPIL